MLDAQQRDTIQSWAATQIGATSPYAMQDVRLMPWSCVWRMTTDRGVFYIKWMAPLFNKEPDILEYLRSSVPTATTPKIVAYSRGLSAFIMDDCGLVLRDIMTPNYNPSLAAQALSSYAQLQRQIHAQAATLPTALFHDRRLASHITQFTSFLDQTTFLHNQGVDQDRINHLRALIPQFTDRSAALQSLGIPDMIDHGDFHDNNILIKNNQITLNDWGDAAWAHPFFSAATFMNSAIRRGAIHENSPSYYDLCQAYLAHWQDFGPMTELQKGLEIARTLRVATFAMALQLVYDTPGGGDAPGLAGYLTMTLDDLANRLQQPFEIPNVKTRGSGHPLTMTI